MGIATHDGALCVCGNSSGVFRSYDAGDNWEPLNTNIGSPSGVRSISSISSVLWAGTTSGIKRLIAGLDNWQSANGSLTANANVWARRFYTFNGVTYAVFNGNILSGGGLYRTTNFGATWVPAHLGLNGTWSVNDILYLDNALYAATTGGLFRSTSEGDVWQPLVGAPTSDLFTIRNLNGRIYLIEASDAISSSLDLFPPWIGNYELGFTAAYPGDIAFYDGRIFATRGNGGLRSDQDCIDFEDYSGGLIPFNVQSANKYHIHENRLYFAFGYDLHVLDESTTSTLEEAEGAGTRIFPTVFTNELTLVVGTATAVCGLELYDASGRVVLRMPILQETSNLALPDLARGVYAAVLVDGTGYRRFVERIFAR